MFGAQSTTNKPSLFGSTPSAGQPSTSLFGNPGNTSTAPQTTSLFGQPSNQDAGTGGTGLFGASAQQSNQNGAGGSLFGAKPPAAPAGTGGTGSLFGGFGSTQPQQQQGGGLFGQQLQQPQQQQQQQGTGIGTSSLFGQNQQPQAGAGSLFGGSTSATAGFGGFGQQQQQQQNNQQQMNQPAFGHLNVSSLNASTSAQSNMLQQFGQQQRPPWNSNNMIPVNKPELQKILEGRKLYEDVKREDPQLAGYLESLEKVLEDQRSIRQGIEGKSLGERLMKDKQEIREMDSQMRAYVDALLKLKAQVDKLNDGFNETVKVYKGCRAALQNAEKNTVSGGSQEASDRQFYIDYFTTLSEALQEQMKRYKQVLSLVTRQLASLQSEPSVPKPKAIAQTVSNNQDSILYLASKVASFEERLLALSETYRSEYRQKFNTAVDPFSLGRMELKEPARGHSGTRGDKALGDDLKGLRMT